MVDVAIFDYGAGNIFSLKTSLEKNGATVDVITSFDQTKNYSGLLLPGVGNFDPAIRSIRDYSATKFSEFVQNKIPVLGICLGMEMFFKQSEEGKEQGLDVINGEVVLLPENMKIPHMGWNSLQIKRDSTILNGVDDGSWVYFVHSYRIKPTDEKIIVANADYGIQVPAVVENGIFYGTQFHPEKSGKVGSLMIKNFLRVCKK
ncbi:MAG TPA: imidazole glycerol phosphate synthase subunit HisH [Candidatus Nitrosopelagicus sp.]|jgi:glutamine amidotransferase|nr:imidazole glycerol phosphate synthase subunit HisH [Candidatus Nitrosopelagicus sp.]|tara:strand:- start:318 stop:926 length:609 start_codon:yes stop_codon:yes gene_type:complete